MKKLWLASAITAMFLGTQAYGDTVTSVNVVGYINLTVYGGAADTYTLIAAPMTKIPVAQGTISGNTTTAITASGVNWAANTFAVGGTAAGELGRSTYYVEVTSGPFEGRHFYIASNDATTLTLAAAMADVNAGDLAGAKFKIIPANRIRDIFGEPGSPALLGANTLEFADQIMFMNNAWSDPVFYKSGGTPIAQRYHWIQGTNIADNLTVDRDIGVLVLRRAGGSNVELTVVGEVSPNAQAAVVVPGWSLAGGMSAVDVPIGQMTAALTNVLVGANTVQDADLIYSWGGTAWEDPVFYKTGGTPIAQRYNWIQGTNIVNETFVIRAGGAYLFKKRGVVSSVWERESPLVD